MECFLPRQDSSRLAQFFRSNSSFWYIGGKCDEYRCSILAMRVIPRYPMEESLHLNSKVLCSVATVSGLREMLRAWDLAQFTRRPEAAVNSFSSLQRLGRDIIGELINSSMSSENKLHLWIYEPQVTPCILGLEHMAIANDLIAIAKIKGDRGLSCLVPLATPSNVLGGESKVLGWSRGSGEPP